MTDSRPGERVPLASELDLLVGDVEPEAGGATAFLVGLSGKHAGKLFKVRPGESSLGRSSQCLVRLEERAASHVHAKLLLNSRGCFIVDQESTNGTFVNGQRVVAPTELHAGDVVRCGTSNFGFLTDAEDDAQHTRAMARMTGSAIPALNAGSRGGALVVRGQHATPSNPLTRVTLPPTGLAYPISNQSGHSLVPAESQQDALRTLDTLLDRIGVIFGLLRDNWRLLVGAAVIGAGLGAASILVRVPLAVATCEIVLRGVGTQNRRPPAANERLVDYFELADKNFVGPDVVRETMKRMELPAGELEKTIQSLELVQAGPSVYEGKYSHVDAHFAEKFLALHVKNFLESQIGKAIAVLKSEVDLLRTQYEENETRLHAIEQKVRDFKLKHLDALPENATAQLGNRSTLQVQRDLLAAQLDRSSQELVLVRKQLKSGDAMLARSVVRSQPYEQALVTVRQELAAAKAKGYADTHPEVVRLKSQQSELESLQRQALTQQSSETELRADATTQALARRVGELEVAVNTTAKELTTVEGRLGSLAKIAGAMPEVEAGYAELQRNLTASQQLHQRLHDQLKAKELQLEFERASVEARYEVMKQPSATPVSREVTAAKRAGVGLAAGLILGALLAALNWLRRYAASRREARLA